MNGNWAFPHESSLWFSTRKISGMGSSWSLLQKGCLGYVFIVSFILNRSHLNFLVRGLKSLAVTNLSLDLRKLMQLHKYPEIVGKIVDVSARVHFGGKGFKFSLDFQG